MPEIHERIVNAKVTAHSKYGSGPEQGVAFEGIEGWWKLSKDLQASGHAWPPPVGVVINVALRAKRKDNGNGFYYDINKVAKATGEAESWAFNGAAPATGAPESAWETPAGPAAHGTPSQPTYVDPQRRSIERQTAFKGITEVLAAALSAPSSKTAGHALDAKMFDWLASEWQATWQELWRGEAPRGYEPDPETPPEEDFVPADEDGFIQDS